MQARIILIEDEEFIRDLYSTNIQGAGYFIDSFATGKEGLEALKKNKYDLLLLDIMLPDTNGLAILKKIKADDSLKNLKVVLLTNLGADNIIKEGFQLGAEGYLIKAAHNPDQIVAEMGKILEDKPRTVIPS